MDAGKSCTDQCWVRKKDHSSLDMFSEEEFLVSNFCIKHFIFLQEAAVA